VVKIVVGLGNPGKQYEDTRHNVGWMVLDRIADRGGWDGRVKSRDAAAVVRGRRGDLDLALVKPMTFMNLSGLAVRKVLAREHTPLEDLLVVVDDFALPLGRLRLREEGSAGGHNGLRSIIAEMGTQQFGRLRVGIGEPTHSALDHVLSRFEESERADLDRVLDAAADAVEEWALQGPTRAANRWNTWRLPLPPKLNTPPTKDAGEGATAESGPSAGPATGGASATRVDADDERPQPGPDGIVRTAHGWRRLLPGTDR
jgi:PTH1 family peptidyl-tRNA hydrolase